MKKYISALLALLIILAVVFSVLDMPVDSSGKAVSFSVAPGSSARRIAADLKQRGLIRSELIFDLFAKIEGLDEKLKVGTYLLAPSMSVQSIVHTLTSGKIYANAVTIPEGYTVEQIADLLVSKGVITDKGAFLAFAKSYAPYSYIEKRTNVKYTCEGFLFPDTYDFAPKSTPQAILQRLTNEFDSRLTAEMRSRAAAQGLSIYDTVIMASLVEREAQKKSEAPIVAGVFYNRLKTEMPLQSCATVEYLLSTRKSVLSIADTQIDSPYNTYQHDGLPPGPIANPGLSSIHAALYPESTEFLFFVADGKGGHYFSKTYEEQLSNEKKSDY